MDAQHSKTIVTQSNWTLQSAIWSIIMVDRLFANMVFEDFENLAITVMHLNYSISIPH